MKNYLACLLLLLISSSLAWPTEANRDGREYYTAQQHRPVNGTESTDVQSLSPPTPRPKSLGKGSWKAIKIWESGPSDPLASSSSSTSKRASAERVVSSTSSSHAPKTTINAFIQLSMLTFYFIKF